MRLEKFLDTCINKGISFSLDGENLKINAEPGALTEELVASIRERKTELLNWLSSAHSLGVESQNLLPRAEYPDLQEKLSNGWLPLSYSQKRLWVIDQVEEGTANYNMVLALKVEGHLDVALVEQTINIIVKRHESLRTRFVTLDEEPIQKVDDDGQLQVISTCLESEQIVDSEQRIRELIEQESKYKFDLSTGPLLRVNLLTLGPETFVIVLNTHHIISDDWSLKVLTSEFGAVYSALESGNTPELKSLSIQYADFAIWQQEELNSNRIGELRKFWLEKLAGIPQVHSLPIDRARPKTQGFEAGCINKGISKELDSKLKSFCLANKVTPFIAYQLVFAILLSRISGEQDIVIGVPSDGRSHSDLESLIGFFNNTLVFRNIVSEEATFLELLKVAKENTLEVFEFQDMPFDLLVDEIGHKRDLSYNPLCQIKFQFLEEHRTLEKDFGPFNISEISPTEANVHFDLDLSIFETRNGPVFTWLFKRELFNDKTIQGMSEQYEQLLAQVIQNPDTKISEMALIPGAEKQKLIELGRGKIRDLSTGKSLISIFELQAEKTPNKVAVQEGGVYLDYQTLNKKVNQFADYLSELGVEPGEKIAIYLDASIPLMLAILAIRKLDATYIPLDPMNAKSRLEYVVTDASIETIITENTKLGDFKLSGLDVISIQDWQSPEWMQGYSETNCNHNVDDNNIAYIIYTSGSTGVPKGVEISNAALLDYCVNGAADYYSNDLNGSLLITSHSFDISVPSLFVPLLNGDCVRLPTQKTNDELIVDAASNLSQSGPLLVRVTPMHLKGILAALPNDLTSNTSHCFVVGGEAFPIELGVQLQSRFPSSTIYNHYGPTEATVGCTLFNVSDVLGNEQLSGDNFPIGSPMANHQIYVLDKYRRMVAKGCTGELYVSGPGLAHGYLNKFEQTEESFVNDPYGINNINGTTKIYGTGDLVKWGDNEQLVFLGRNDHQYKIQGYRVETQEIEKTIKLLNDVDDAIVSVISNETSKSLVAYVVGNTSREVLERSLKQTLPQYMVPSKYVFLESFPLNSVGKVDRVKLDQMEVKGEQFTEIEAPRTAVEKKIADVWSKLLKLEKVGINDNFFSLGGDSILSIQAVSRSASQGVFFTTRQLFEHQTIKSLAKVAGDKCKQKFSQNEVDGSLILTPIQAGFVRTSTHPNYFNQSVMLEISSKLETQIVNQILTKIVERHDALRLSFTKDETAVGYRAIFNPQDRVEQEVSITKVCVESLEQSVLDEHANEAHRRINIEHGPLMQCVLFEAPEGNRLLWIIHHLVVDGVSWRILLEDLNTLLSQSQAGKPLKLSAKTSSVKDWGLFLRDSFSIDTNDTRIKDKFLKESGFWKKQLQSIESHGSIIQSEVSKEASKPISITKSIELSKDNTYLLTTKALQSYSLSINEILLASLFYGFYQWNGSLNLPLTMEGHGREYLDDSLDLTQTVGWFTCKYPLALTIGNSINGLATEDSKLEMIITAVKEQIRGVPNGGIGFGFLKEFTDECLEGREAPQIVFNYLGQFDNATDDDSPVAFANETTGLNIHPENAPDETFMFNSLIVEGELVVNLTFDKDVISEQKAVGLLKQIKLAMESVVSHCVKPVLRPKTVSDFPQARVTQKEIEHLYNTYQVENIYEATGMQSGLLFHSEMSADAYVSQMLFTVDNLNIEAFKYAWEQLVSRHDILRTAFYLSDSGYHQIVTNASLAWSHYDLSTESLPIQEKKIEDFRVSDKNQGFDIANAQLMRISVFKLCDSSYRVLWSHHHALWDGWCNALLFREVIYFYEAKLANQSIQLKKPPQYLRYIDWIQRQDAEAAQNYWKEYLASIETETSFPQQVSTSETRTVRLEASISKELTSKLGQLALDNNFTMNTFIQASWSILLSRYTGTDKAVFGTVVSGRPAQLEGVEEIVGLFINTIPVVVDLLPELGVDKWLHAIHHRHLDSDEFSFLPLNEIKKCSTTAELFDTLVAFENYPADSLQEDASSDSTEITISNVDSFEETNYGLTLIVHVDSQLHFKLDYKSGLYEERIVNGILPHLENILASLVRSLEAPECSSIQEIQILSEEEHRVLTQELNKTEVDYPFEQRLHDLFIEQVKQAPESIAVRDSEGSLTYEELFNRAYALNLKLRSLKVEVDELIAVRLPKGRDQLIATLGIMMSGAAYLPLETKWPDDRCTRVTKKAGCQYLILSNEEAQLPHLSSISVNGLNNQEYSSSDALTKFSNLQSPSDLAYVIFTSGSTGEPKGVAIEHRSAVNTLLDINSQYQVTADDKVLAVSALSFDLSVYDLFGLLAVGGEVIFPDDGKAMDPAHWLEMIEKYQVTLWDTVPVSASLLEEQLSFKKRSSSAPLRNILMSGDWIEPGLPARLWRAFPGVNTYSLGGATEGSIWSIHYPIRNDTSGLKSVPYGKPLSNQQFYILDKFLNLAPLGVAGELCIGGVGVAREYYGDEKLTNDRFIFHKQLNQKLYRTGDLGRYMVDGNIEFMGRADHQIKIRGFRIELGEIEQRLTSCNEVLTSLVRAKQDNSGQKFLVAYFQREQEQKSLGEAELILRLRQQLEKDLPDYMLPSFYIEVAAWPLTSNGKVDLKSLPEVEYLVSHEKIVPPETETQIALAELWGELLSIESAQVSIDTDFIELGGHSLLAVRLIARIEHAFGLKVELRQLYLNSSVRKLAAVIDKLLEQQNLTKKLDAMSDSEVEEFSL